MSDLDDAGTHISRWLQRMDDEAAPCGPDLEYDNDFLALTQAAAGKPESQFGPAEPPDWRKTRELAESLLGRSRDLRAAILWLRAGLHLSGYPALPVGLRLVNGMLESMWDGMHPLPDPDDGDLYARVNALTVLCTTDGLIGDLRLCHVVRDRSVGELSGRALELAASLADPFGDEAAPSLESLRQMMAAAVDHDPALREFVLDAARQVGRLESLAGERLGGDAPDFSPLRQRVAALVGLLPQDTSAADAKDADGSSGAGDGAGRRGLAGSVGTREEALRAIDMVCEYLERHEPTNPAPLFLRRARQLVGHNFLQLVKELAPGSLAEVARMVGVDPDTVETPNKP